MVDVVVLATLYTIRIIAGTAAVGTQLTFWLLAFSMLIILSLLLIKQYAELHLGGDNCLGRRVASRRNVTRRIVVVSLSFFFSFVVFRARSARPPPAFNFSAVHTSVGVSVHWRMLPRTISLTRSARHALTRRCSVRSCVLRA